MIGYLNATAYLRLGSEHPFAANDIFSEDPAICAANMALVCEVGILSDPTAATHLLSTTGGSLNTGSKPYPCQEETADGQNHFVTNFACNRASANPPASKMRKDRR